MRTPMLATVLTLALCGTTLAEARIIVVQDTPPPTAVESPQAAPAEPPPSEPQPMAPPPASPAPAPLAPAPQAAAPIPPAPVSSSRFRFERASEGYLRLDNDNGQIAYCAPRSAGWTCQAVPEDRAALENEIARYQGEVTRLREEVSALKREVAALREPPSPPRPPAELSPPPPAPKEGDKSGDLTIKLPTQNDIDRATAALQRAWDRVVDMIGNLTKDLSRKPQPDRTTL